MVLENEKVYSTNHRGLGTFLLYTLGDDSLIDAVKVGGKAIQFRFHNDHPEWTCEYLAGLFFSKVGAAVSSSRELLEAGRLLNTFANAAKTVEKPK
jgi:hypothetical protein